MRVHFKPKTKLGIWSAWLIVAFVVFFVAFQVIAASGQQGGDTFFSNLLLAIPMVLSATSGIAAFITGVVSIGRKKERSLSVYLAVAFGLIVLVFTFRETLVPH